VAQSLARRRLFRHHLTDAEAELWKHLRRHQIGGFKFRRQHPCGPFVLDFYCVAKRLAIELDGGQHLEPRGLAYHRRRDAFLAARGITVLRFPCDQVFRELEGILVAIAFELGVERSRSA